MISKILEQLDCFRENSLLATLFTSFVPQIGDFISMKSSGEKTVWLKSSSLDKPLTRLVDAS